MGRIPTSQLPPAEQERLRAYARARHAVRQADPSYRAQNVAKAKAWREAHPERNRVLSRVSENVSRAAKKGSRIVERVDPMVVLARSCGVCGICGEPVDPDRFHVDHIQPLSRGGEHSYENAQATHPGCNQRKASKWSF